MNKTFNLILILILSASTLFFGYHYFVDLSVNITSMSSKQTDSMSNIKSDLQLNKMQTKSIASIVPCDSSSLFALNYKLYLDDLDSRNLINRRYEPVTFSIEVNELKNLLYNRNQPNDTLIVMMGRRFSSGKNGQNCIIMYNKSRGNSHREITGSAADKNILEMFPVQKALYSIPNNESIKVDLLKCLSN